MTLNRMLDASVYHQRKDITNILKYNIDVSVSPNKKRYNKHQILIRSYNEKTY
jgi:hypothetical protein